MTKPAKPDAAAQPELDFLANHKSLLSVRVRPAEFARILGVSKQTVSVWIRGGKVTINALDGLLDVRRAIQDVLRNTSPGRLRSRVLRQAVTDALALRQNLASAEDRAAAVEAALAEARSMIAHLEKWIADGDRAEKAFMHMIVGAADDLRASPTETWMAILDGLYNAVVDAVDAVDGVIDPSLASGQLDAEAADYLDDATTMLDQLDAEAGDALDAFTARDPATSEGGGGDAA